MANTGQPGTTRQPVLHRLRRHASSTPTYTVLGTVTRGLDLVKKVGAAGDDGAFAEQAGGGHPKKEVLIKTLTMSARAG